MRDGIISNLEYVALKLVGGLTYKDVNHLIATQAINDYKDISIKKLNEIIKDKDRYGLSDITINHLSSIVSKSDEVKRAADGYMTSVLANDIHVISRESKQYPHVWTNLTGMPDVFFARGNVDLLDYSCACGSAAIVGSRSPSGYALYATRQFATDIGLSGKVIISGMALGIDREAHLACLDKGIGTIAVMPGGVDVIYPYQNKDIYEGMCELGLVISEMPPGYRPIKQYFPARNRLISALSDVTIVMEAGEHSGTLHTATFAAAQGKDVFVLPNSIYSQNSIGGLYLIKDGAEILINSNIVIERINHTVCQRLEVLGKDVPDVGKILVNEHNRLSSKMLEQKADSNPSEMTDEDWKELILLRIQEKPRSADNLCDVLRIPFGVLSRYLTELELSKKIEMFKDKYILTIVGH